MRAKQFGCAFKLGFLQFISKASLILRLVILFDMLLNPSFKMVTRFTNIDRTTASTSKFIF